MVVRVITLSEYADAVEMAMESLEVIHTSAMTVERIMTAAGELTLVSNSMNEECLMIT